MLPSDIARLVLGYLHDEGLEATSRAFLMESPHLEELRQNPNSSILRPSTKSLIGTLEEYEDIKDAEKRRNVPDKVLTGLWRKFDSVLGQIKYKYQPSENSLEAQAIRSKQNLVILRQQQVPPGNNNIVIQPKIQGQLIVPNTSTPITIVTTPKKSQAVVTPLSNPVTRVPIPYTAGQVVVPNVLHSGGETATVFATNPASTVTSSPGRKPSIGRRTEFIPSNTAEYVVGNVGEGGIVPRQRRDSCSSINSASDSEYSQLSPLKQRHENTVFKSPKRKSGAPKRKPARIPPDHQKNPDPPPPPSGLTPTEEELEETLKDLPQVLETLLSNRELQQKLAGNINKSLPVGSQKQDLGVPASPQDPSVGLSLSMDDILNTQMSEDTVSEIIDNTSHDPAFESLFSLFNVDKDKYVEQQREEIEKRKRENDQSTSSIESDFAEPMETNSLQCTTPSSNTNSVPPMAIYGKSPTDSFLSPHAEQSKMASAFQHQPPISTVLHISENSQVEMESVVLPSLDGSEPQIMSPVSVSVASPAPQPQMSIANVMPNQQTTNSYTSRNGCMVPPKKRQHGLRMENHRNATSGNITFKSHDNAALNLTSQQGLPVGSKTLNSDIAVTLSQSKNKLSDPSKSNPVQNSDTPSSFQSTTKSESVDKPSTSFTIQDINEIIAQAKRDLFNPTSPSKPAASAEKRTSRSRNRRSNTQPRRISGRKTKSPDRFSPCTPSKSRKRVVSPVKEPISEKSTTQDSTGEKDSVVYGSTSTKPRSRSRSKTQKKVDKVSEQTKFPAKSVSTTPTKHKTEVPKSDYLTPSKMDRPPLRLEVTQPNTHDATSFMAALQMSPSGIRPQAPLESEDSMTSTSKEKDISKSNLPPSDKMDQGPLSLQRSPTPKQQVSTSEMLPTSRTPEKASNKINQQVGSPATTHRKHSLDSISEASVETPVFVPTNVQSDDTMDLDSEPNTPQMQIISQPNTPLTQAMMSPGQALTPVPLTPQVGEIVEIETTPEIEQTETDENSQDSVITVESLQSQESQGVESFGVVPKEIKPGADDNVCADKVEPVESVTDNTNAIVAETSCETSDKIESPEIQASEEMETVEVEFVVEETGERVENVNLEALTERAESMSCNTPKAEHNKKAISSEVKESYRTKPSENDSIESQTPVITSEGVEETEQSSNCESSASKTKQSEVSENTSAMLQRDSECMDISKPERTIARVEVENVTAVVESVKSPELQPASVEVSEEIESDMSTSDKVQEKQDNNRSPKKSQQEASDHIDKPAQTESSEKASKTSHSELLSQDTAVLQCAKPIQVHHPVKHIKRQAVVTVPCVISSGDELEPTAILQAPVLLPHVKTPAKDQKMNVPEDVQDSIKPMQALLKAMSTDTTGVTGSLPLAVTSNQLPMQLVHSKLNANPTGSKVRRILPKKIGPPATILTRSISDMPISAGSVFSVTPIPSRTVNSGVKGQADSHIRETPKKTDLTDSSTPRQMRQSVVVSGKHSSGKSSHTRPPLRRFVKTGTPQVKSSTPQSNKRGMVMRSLDVGGNAIEASTPKTFNVPRGSKGGYVARTLDCHQAGGSVKPSVSPKEQGYNLAKPAASPKDYASYVAKSTVSPKDHVAILGKPTISPKDHTFDLPAVSKISINPKDITPRKRTPRKQDLSAAASRDFEATVDLAAEVLASCSPRKTPIKQGRHSSGGSTSEMSRSSEELRSRSTSPQARFTAIQSAGILRNVMNAPKRNLMSEHEMTKVKTNKESGGSMQGRSEEKRRGRGRPRLKEQAQEFRTASDNPTPSRTELFSYRTSEVLVLEAQIASDNQAQADSEENKTSGGRTRLKEHAQETHTATDSHMPSRTEPLPNRTSETVKDHAIGQKASNNQESPRSKQLPDRTLLAGGEGNGPHEAKYNHAEKKNIPKINGDIHIPNANDKSADVTGTSEEGTEADMDSKVKKKIKAKKRRREEAPSDQPEIKKAKKNKLKRKSFPTNMDVDKFLSQLHYPQ